MEMTAGRRIRGGILAGALLTATLLVAACGGSGATPQVIYTMLPPTLAPGATPTPAPPPPEISSVILASNAPDGRWTAIFKKPVVGGVSAASATKMNDAISSKVDAYITAFTSGSLPALNSGAGPSTLDGNFSIALDTLSVVSLRFSILTYVTGAAHPVAQAGSVNLDVSSGATIALGDLFTSTGAALPILTDKTHAALLSALGADLSWPSSSIDITFFEKAWAFTPAELEFTWSQGEIASESAGTPSAVVVWSDLKSAVNPTGAAAAFVH
jgi:hypothetical protein